MSAPRFTVVETLTAFLAYLNGNTPEKEVDTVVRKVIDVSPRLKGFETRFRELLQLIGEQFEADGCWKYSVFSMRVSQYPINALTRAEILSFPAKAETIALDKKSWSIETILLVDRETERVWYRGTEIVLPHRQFSILYSILRRNGQISMEVLREDLAIFDGIYDADEDSLIEANAAQMAIKALVKTMTKYGPFGIPSINDKFCLNTNNFLLIDCLG